MPDAVGNLFRAKERNDRKYGPAGQLLKSGGTRYAYDEEGNLVRKTEASGQEWLYEWNASGMLGKVIRPDGEAVSFTYDALGRRLSKTFCGRTTRWVWDGNTPLHEWVESTKLLGEARRSASEAALTGGHELQEDLVTWLFEPESFAPLAKLMKQGSYGIISDHLGTPLSMHTAAGETVWAADLNCYGQVRNLRGNAEDCPFRYPGQYEDVETGLYYNRFRYYDAKEGMYVSQDPIGLQGGDNFYTYVHDLNTWVDALGLKPCNTKTKRWKVGDDVYAPTSKGKEPAWSTVRSRFWKNEAVKSDAAQKYGAENMSRMSKGLAPERYNPAKGGIEKMELSHEPIPLRDGGRDFIPRWPQDHAAVDPFRRPGY
jgi:RHS repeat-associated protein